MTGLVPDIQLRSANDPLGMLLIAALHCMYVTTSSSSIFMLVDGFEYSVYKPFISAQCMHANEMTKILS